MALQNRAVFVHGAALERDGQALLFPSWGGVGKTALVAELVRSHGWGFLGDDLTLVDESGWCYAFPKAMVLYPYHRALFPEVFAAGRGPVAPAALNRVLTRAGIALKPVLRRFPSLLQFARRHNPQSVRVNPSAVFSAQRLRAGAAVRASIWLERRNDIAQPELREANGSVPARVFGSTMNEFDWWCVRLTNVAMGLGIQSLDTYVGGWREVLDRALGSRPQYVLNLPASLPVEEVPDAVRQALDAGRLIEATGVPA